ncbi:MAG: hypothetical protein JST05_03070 [Acidobacteria bacterium]|nr:hypothetical protein [Acidobacteriota bacterium]
MKAAILLLLPFALACHAPKAGPTAPETPMETESLLWIRVEPSQAEVAPSGTLALRVSLNYPKGVNYLRPPVKWSVQESGGGAVDVMGHYTAPAEAGTYHVVAERTDAKGVRAIATLTVK